MNASSDRNSEYNCDTLVGGSGSVVRYFKYFFFFEKNRIYSRCFQKHREYMDDFFEKRKNRES